MEEDFLYINYKRNIITPMFHLQGNVTFLDSQLINSLI